MTGKSLQYMRDEVNKIDKQIVALLNERARLSIEIGKLKTGQDLEIYDPAQESKVFRDLCGINTGPLPEESLRKIFGEILSASRALQLPVKVAYLGPDASFSHLATESHFGKSVLLSPQPGILDVFDRVEKREAQLGVVPVENSLEGTVKLTLDCLISTSLEIVNEIYLPISHSLISMRKGLDGLEKVYSHSQALAQCQGWLRKNLPLCSLHEVESTAKAVQMALEDNKIAAVGSREAALKYGLNIIVGGIEDYSTNMTRFLVIGKGANEPTGTDKTSVLFGTRHEPGALYHSLQSFVEKGINLLKIVSHPIRGRMWEYLFFVDFAGHAKDEEIVKCLKSLQDKCTFVKILGSYPRGDSKS